MWWGVTVAFGLAIAGGAYLTLIAGWVVVAIGAASILAALGYTGGPVPYGYHGLGEAFVFVFFGLVATVGSRYIHDQTAPLDAWLLAVPVGLLVTAILVANNVRDLDTDRATGKRTLAVILGRSRTRHLFAVLVNGAFVTLAVWGLTGWVERWALLGLIGVVMAPPIVRTVYRETAGPALIIALKGTAKLHAVTGALIALGAAL
jgi:1,4-dihydroxy-2-naphthoate octaprenyltransferase